MYLHITFCRIKPVVLLVILVVPLCYVTIEYFSYFASIHSSNKNSKRRIWLKSVEISKIMELQLLLHILLFTIGVKNDEGNLPPPCDSPIYCLASNISLLHVVQMRRIYKDSKTFVDKAIKKSPEDVLRAFDSLMMVSTFYESCQNMYLFNIINFRRQTINQPWMK